MEVLTSLELPAAYAPMRPNRSNNMAASSEDVCKNSANQRNNIGGCVKLPAAPSSIGTNKA
ncbi:unnamed protein product [Alopecurus aequalis]